MSRKPIDLKYRLYKNSQWNGECLESTYSTRTDFGYRLIKFNYKMILVHRAAWMLEYGEIPNGSCVCHKCDNPKCIRIEHLFLGTHLENMRDMIQKNRKDLTSRVKYDKNFHLKVEEMRKNGVRFKDIRNILNIPKRSLCDIMKRNKKNEVDRMEKI